MSGRRPDGYRLPPADEPRREPGVAVAAAVACLASGYGALVCARAGGWWWLAVGVWVLLCVTCAYGVGESLEKRPRP